MKAWLTRNIPLGCDAAAERKWLTWGAVAGFLMNLRFPVAYYSAWQQLFPHVNGRRIYTGGAMAPFGELLGFSLWGCLLAAAAMAVLAVWHYACHFRGSRSIYTMRRLPQRWELAKRCLAVPAAGAAAYLLEAAVLLALDYAVYCLVTPGYVPLGL